MDEAHLLELAVKQYGFHPSRLRIERKLQANHWHGDLHFHIHIDDKSYSARIIGNKRYETDAFIKLSNEVLNEQIRFSQYLLHSGIPFMKHVPTRSGESFTSLRVEEKEWRFVLFEWMKGEHLTHCTETIARTFGAFARKIHNLSSKFETNVFPQESHSKGHQEFYQLLCSHAASHKLSPTASSLLTSYLSEAEYHKDHAMTDTHDFIAQN
ncbi:hypothetical protein [Paenibacillus sp. J31TS4]|uniref:hypothetical protein n=1 Tax=Paenibacillus sp. J31TS4 TaxID=2807195 RepID=UPI0035B53F90